MSTSLKKEDGKSISHYNELYHCIQTVKNEKADYFLKTLNFTEWAATSLETRKK